MEVTTSKNALISGESFRSSRQVRWSSRCRSASRTRIGCTRSSGWASSSSATPDPDPRRHRLRHRLATLYLQDGTDLHACRRKCVLEFLAGGGAALAQHHPLSCQVVDAHRHLTRPGMSVPHEQHDAVAAERHRAQPNVIIGARHDGHVGPEREQAPEHFLRVAQGDRQLDLGVAPAERDDHVRDVGGTDRSDPQPADEASAGGAQGFGRFGLQTEDPLGDFGKPATGVGQLDVVSMAAEQLDSEALLQRLDVGGDARLTDEERSSRGGEAALLDDGVETSELLEIDLLAQVHRVAPRGMRPGPLHATVPSWKCRITLR